MRGCSRNHRWSSLIAQCWTAALAHWPLSRSTPAVHTNTTPSALTHSDAKKSSSFPHSTWVPACYHARGGTSNPTLSSIHVLVSSDGLFAVGCSKLHFLACKILPLHKDIISPSKKQAILRLFRYLWRQLQLKSDKLSTSEEDQRSTFMFVLLEK